MSSDSQLNGCEVCGKPASNVCSRCRGRRYCSREHQTQDWPQHKQHCSASTTSSSSTSSSSSASSSSSHQNATGSAIDYSGVAQNPEKWSIDQGFDYCAPMTLLHVLDLASQADPPLLPPHKLPHNVEELTVHFAGAFSGFEPEGDYGQVLRRLPRLRRLNIVFQGFLPRRREGHEEADRLPTRHGKPQQKKLPGGRVLTTVCFGNGQLYHEFARACASSREHAAFCKPDIVFLHNPGLDQYLDQWSPSITELIRMRVLTVLTGYSKDKSRQCHPRILRRYGAKEVISIRDNRFTFSLKKTAGVYKSHNLMAFKGPREEFEAAGGECELPTDYENMMIELCEKEGVELQPDWLIARGLPYLIPESAFKSEMSFTVSKEAIDKLSERMKLKQKQKEGGEGEEQRKGPDFSKMDAATMGQFVADFMRVGMEQMGLPEGFSMLGVQTGYRDPKTGATGLAWSKP